jgi:hypothetical protein
MVCLHLYHFAPGVAALYTGFTYLKKKRKKERKNERDTFGLNKPTTFYSFPSLRTSAKGK